ncbi:MazG-like family protein [Streptomyces sp. NPDC058642]|uniref:MazG-like family protein n=1 Tax=Streptomyces sp. NPDC058642 TaxID=3346572 RepID=UPI003664EE45
MHSTVWDTIHRLARRFNEHDAALGLGQEEQWSLQILKIAEETGEAAQAVIGARGTNPRKATAPWEEAHAEVADVVITALVSLAACAPTTPRNTSTGIWPPSRRSSFSRGRRPSRPRRSRHEQRPFDTAARTGPGTSAEPAG